MHQIYTQHNGFNKPTLTETVEETKEILMRLNTNGKKNMLKKVFSEFQPRYVRYVVS